MLGLNFKKCKKWKSTYHKSFTMKAINWQTFSCRYARFMALLNIDIPRNFKEGTLIMIVMIIWKYRVWKNSPISFTVFSSFREECQNQHQHQERRRCHGSRQKWRPKLPFHFFWEPSIRPCTSICALHFLLFTKITYLKVT